MKYIGIVLSLATALITCHGSKTKMISPCTCDTSTVGTSWRTTQADSLSHPKNFYRLSREENRQLWFQDIESIDSTEYTRLWDAYHENNFMTSHEAFRDYYFGRENVEMALQIGPHGPLWTYHTFVLRRSDCCFVITKTNYTHARFRYKAYSIMDPEKVDSLFLLIANLDRNNLTEDELNNMRGTIVDNRNNDQFDILFENFKSDRDRTPIPPDSSITRFIHFVDEGIQWIKTYQ